MIPKRALFSSVNDSKSWKSHFHVKNYKFLRTTYIQEDSHPFILKRNIKIIQSLKLKSLEGNTKGTLKMSHIVNSLCKKDLSISKLKFSHKAILSHLKFRFFGFKRLKKLRTLKLDLILYPRRSQYSTNWSEMFQSIVNSSKKLQTLSLTFRNSYCMQGELKRCFSRNIRLKSLENFQLIVANPPVNGNSILKGGSCFLQKTPNLKNVRLKSGYSGLKVDSGTYVNFLKALYKIPCISNVDLDFDISFIKRSPKPEQFNWSKFPSNQISSLVLNIKVRDRILKYLNELLHSVPELKKLDIRFVNKDICDSNEVYHNWIKIIDIISKREKLKEIKFEHQTERKYNKAKVSKIFKVSEWIKKQFEGLCLRRNRKNKIIQQNEHLMEKFLEISQKKKVLENFSIKFPQDSQPFFTDLRSSK